MEIKDGKTFIRTSEVDTFGKCGEMYRRRYIDGEIKPPRIAMIKGTAVHTGASTNFKQKITSKEDLSEQEICAATSIAFDCAIAEEDVELTKEEKSVGKAAVLGEHKDKAIKLASLYTTGIAPRYQPVAVEERQYIDLGRCTLHGQPDFETEGAVVDLKTTGKRWPQGKADKSLQFTSYSLLYYNRLGWLPDLRYEIMVENKTPIVQTLNTMRGEADWACLRARLENLLDAIEKGSYQPAPTGDWICDPRWCGYYSTCKYVLGGTQ